MGSLYSAFQATRSDKLRLGNYTLLSVQHRFQPPPEAQSLPASEPYPLFWAEANGPRNKLHGRQGFRQVFHFCVDGGCCLRIRSIRRTLGHYRVFGRFCSTSSLLGDRRLLGVVCRYRLGTACIIAIFFAFRVAQHAPALVDSIFGDGEKIVAREHVALHEVILAPLEGFELFGTGFDKASVLYRFCQYKQMCRRVPPPGWSIRTTASPFSFLISTSAS